MTVRQYIEDKFRALGLTDAQMSDFVLATELSPDAEYDAENADIVGRAMIDVVAESLLTPYTQSVSESGFSVTYNRDNLSKYYMYLCKKYGVTPDDGVVALLGISTITDRTDTW